MGTRERLAAWLIGAGVLFFAGLIALLWGDSFSRVLLEPLGSASQWLWQWVLGWPSEVWWALGLLLLVILGSRSLAGLWRQTGTRSLRRSMLMEESACSPGPAHQLAERIQDSPQGPLFQQRIRRELAHLATDIVSLRHELPEQQAVERIRAGDWCNDPVIEAFLQERLEIQNISAWERLMLYVRKPKAKGFQKELEKAAAFLEAYAEERDVRKN